jgi:phosphinothricin acetyltransferase
MKALDVHLAVAPALRQQRRVTPPEPPIRDAREIDAEAIAAIYAHHVLHGTASFDTEPPRVEHIRSKIHAVLDAGWPFLVAERGGGVIGYAYATQFRDRPAYRFACENSIYVHPDCMGQGIGKRLLQALMVRSAERGFKTMVAVIGGGEAASVALHAGCGFEEVGRLRRVGWKKERWLDSVYMQRDLPEVR